MLVRWKDGGDDGGGDGRERSEGWCHMVMVMVVVVVEMVANATK